MTFKTQDDLKDSTKMSAALKKARGASSGGKFVFFFSCTALEGAPVLLLGLPGKALHKPLVKELVAGGKPIKGSYRGIDGQIHFYPKKEVNAKRMHKTICVIGKKNKINLAKDDVIVYTPAMVAELQAQEAQEQQEVVDKLNKKGTTNRTLTGQLEHTRKQLGALGSKLLSAFKKKQEPDPKLVIKTILEEGTVPINTKTVSQPPPPEHLQLTELSSQELQKQAAVALESHKAANVARLQLAQSQRTLEELVKAAEALKAKNGLPEKIADEMAPTVERLINDIEKQKLVIQQAEDQAAAVLLARRKALQKGWSKEDQERLDSLQEAVTSRETEIKRRDATLQKQEKAHQEKKEKAREQLSALRGMWDTLNEMEDAQEEFEAALPEQRKLWDDRIQRWAQRVKATEERLQKGANPKLEGELKQAQEKLAEAHRQRGELDRQARVRKNQLDLYRKEVEQAEDAMDSGDSARKAEGRRLLTEARKNAEKEVETASFAVEKGQQLVDGYEKQLEGALLAFEEDATLSGSYDPIDAREAKENRKRLADSTEALQKADKALQEALDARGDLQLRIRMLQADKGNTLASVEKRQEAARALVQVRGELLKAETGLTTLRAKAEGARIARQQAESQVEKDRALLEEIGEKMPGHFAEVQELRLALLDARQEQSEAVGRLLQVSEEATALKREQDIQQNLDEALKLLNHNDQLTKRLRKMGTLEKLTTDLAKTTILSDDPTLKRLRERTDVDAMREQVAQIDAEIRKENEGLEPEDQQLLLSDMVSKLIQKTEEMRVLGASPEQMFQVWDRIPDALTPEKYVREAQNWRRMQEQLAKEVGQYKEEHPKKALKDTFLEAMENAKDTLEKGSTYTGALKKGVGLVDKATGLPLQTVKAAAKVAEAPEKVLKVLETLKSAGDMVPGVKELNEKVLAPLMPLIQTVSGLAKLVAQSEAADKIKQVTEVTKTARKVVTEGTSLLDTAVKTGEKVEKTGEKLQSTSDPIKTLMLKEDLADAVAGLLKAAIKLGLNIAGTVLPLIGALSDSLDSLGHIIEAVRRGKLTVQDFLLVEDAEKLKSDLTESVQQSRDREAELGASNLIKGLAKGAEAVGKATIDITKLAGGQDGGSAAAVGTGIKVSGMVVYHGTTVVVTLKSWAQAAYCEILALKAASGDTSAQRKIFRHSGKYAKGLLALMAKENDPVALAYIKSRGLTPEMIERSAPEIIRMYLLRRSRESNFTEGPGTLEKLKGGLRSAIGVVEKLAKAIEDLSLRAQKADWEEFASTDFACDLTLLGDACADLSGAREALGEAPDEELAEKVATLESLLQDIRGALLESTDTLQTRLEVVTSLELGLRKEKDLVRAKKAAGFVQAVEYRLGENWAALDHLAQVV